MRFLALAAAICVFGAATSALAQTTPQAMTDVYACAQVAGDAERLACFDRAVGLLREAENQGQLVAVDRGQAREIERDSFGFHLPSISRLLPDLQGGSDEIDNVQMTVASVRRSQLGYHSFVMENGQVWTQVEPQSARNVRAGDTITINRAALGSFRLSSSRGGAGHRVRREN
jgi:hypothetical protein